MYPVITISREFGSGGHTIGKKVAEQLGIPFYDSEIVERVAIESGYDKEIIEDQGEYTSVLEKYFTTNLYAGKYFETPQDQMYRIQANIIKDLAKKGPCVIVGRCADYILESEDVKTLNVFIHADIKSRQVRVEKKYGKTDVPIEKRLAKKDKGRKAYYRYYTDRQWGDYKNYHMNIDSGALGEDKCVEILTSVAKDY